jgi:hypothetical protein
MSARTIRRNITIAAVVTLVAAIVILVTTSAFGPLIGVVVLALGALALADPTRASRANAPVLILAGVLGVGAVAMAYVLDNSWLSAAFVLACVAALLFIGLSVRTQLRPSAPLSAAATQALAKAGVTLAGDSLAGWSSGLARNGAVILIREIDSSPGPVEDWKSLSRLSTSIASVKKAMVDQGVAPLIVVIPKATPGILHRTASFTVCSLDKLSHLIGATSPGITDPRALAAQAGVTINRAVTRRLSGSGSTGASKSKVIHSGRVTKKISDQQTPEIPREKGKNKSKP